MRQFVDLVVGQRYSVFGTADRCQFLDGGQATGFRQSTRIGGIPRPSCSASIVDQPELVQDSQAVVVTAAFGEQRS